MLGKQFVLGRNIEEALARGRKRERKGYRYSFDMLGEAAITHADAESYFQAYAEAIKQIGASAKEHGPIHAPGHRYLCLLCSNYATMELDKHQWLPYA